MKRILIALAVLLTFQIADAQVKSPADAQKGVDDAILATENPKKATKVATWLKLADAYMNAYTAPMGNGWVGASRAELSLLMGKAKPKAVKEVTLNGQTYKKEVYNNMNYYYNAKDVLAIIEVTKPVMPNTLKKALEAYLKAVEVDAKGTKTKDINAGIKLINTKYLELAMTEYNLGNLKAASRNFERAAEALETAPTPAVDTMAIYNAGFTAWVAGENEMAEKNLKRCVELKYLEDGETFAKLADVYTKMDNKQAAKETLEAGFSAFPQNQSILIGLINYYIESGDNPDKLFSLLNEAKKNEPNNASLYYVEGDIHSKLGHKEEAVAAYLKSNEINPDYEFGLIGVGILYYNEAIEIQTKAQEEMDDAKYTKLVEQFEEVLMKAVDPFEKAFNVTKDNQIKVSISEYLKNIFYRFREKGAEFEAGYNKYNDIVNNGIK